MIRQRIIIFFNRDTTQMTNCR